MHPIILLLTLLLKGNSCDWASEWLVPLEYQYKNMLTRDSINRTIPEEANSELSPTNPYLQMQNEDTNLRYRSKLSNEDAPSKSLKLKLEETLKTAEKLAANLKKHIKFIENQERLLKEAIANGRSGVTTVTVSSLEQSPRSYIIRDGFWSLCNGMIQYPTNQTTFNMFSELFAPPRCIGQEVTSKRDPCVFNSIVKYETVPVTRRLTYYEDDYLCLRDFFNSTLENYMSVPKKVVDETCKNGVIRSIADNILECGVRVLSEYTYYPRRDSTAILPLEYCAEKDGSCKLIVAWHLSNETIENFEFLKGDQNFKKFFIKSESYIEPFI